MLNELDKELHNRGNKFVRYADDLVILCKSKRAEERIKDNVAKFIEGSLFLKVNRDKTSEVHFNQIKILGYSFYQSKGVVRFRIHPNSIVKKKLKLRLLTNRNNGWRTEKRKRELSLFYKRMD